MNQDVDEVILRSYPKVIFFYPTAIASLILGLFAQFIPILNVPAIDFSYWFAVENNWIIDGRIILGLIWFANFAGNLFIVSFDYSSSKVVAMIAFLIAGILVVIVLMAYFPNLGQNIPTFSINMFGLTMSFWFYYCAGGLFGIVFALIWIGKRWDYYKITSQDIVHKTGIFGDLERFPAPNIQMHKRIADVFEYLFLKAGEMTIIPAQRTTIIHLPVVLNINEIEKKIQEVLGTLEVEVEST
ncbi:MAG: hypothetical protein ACTSRG_11650 [Candidatus Helarchaeota archaeon]